MLFVIGNYIHSAFGEGAAYLGVASVVDCFSCAMVCDESERNSSCTEMAFFVPEKRARRTSGAWKAPHLLNGNEGNA